MNKIFEGMTASWQMLMTRKTELQKDVRDCGGAVNYVRNNMENIVTYSAAGAVGGWLGKMFGHIVQVAGVSGLVVCAICYVTEKEGTEKKQTNEDKVVYEDPFL